MSANSSSSNKKSNSNGAADERQVGSAATASTASEVVASGAAAGSASAAVAESPPMMSSKRSDAVSKETSCSTSCGAASEGGANAAAGSSGKSGAAEEAVTLMNALAAIQSTVENASTPAQHRQTFTHVLNALTASFGAQAGVHDQLLKHTFTSRLAYSQPTSWDEFHALVVQKWGARDEGQQPNKSLLEIQNRLAALTSGKYMPRPRKVALATELLAYLATLLAWKQGSAAE